MWLDVEWRKKRGPTEEEAKKIDGSKQTMGFGEFSESSYMEAWANNPKYAGYLANEGKKDHLDLKEFAECVTRRETPIVSGKEKPESAEQSGMRIKERSL